MTISKEGAFILVIFLLYIGGDIYTTRIAHQKLETYIKESGDWAVGNMLRNANIETRIDSLKVETAALAKTVIYLDSCQQQKAQKQDKAERRGRFVGGLLKGLFPGL